MVTYNLLDCVHLHLHFSKDCALVLLADPESDGFPPEVPWPIWDCFATAVIDLFTSEESAQCPLFFSLEEATHL